MRRVAAHLHYQGRETEIERLRVTALHVAEQLFEPRAYEIVRAKFALAETLTGLCRYEQAERLCLQVVLEHSETTGRQNYAQRKECPDTLTSMATANFPYRICLWAYLVHKNAKRARSAAAPAPALFPQFLINASI